MTLEQVKKITAVNCIFEFEDRADGLVEVPIGNFHDVEFGTSAVMFEEGGMPTFTPVTTRTEAFESHSFRLRGKNDDEIASAYLGAFYHSLLKNQLGNQPPIMQKSINTMVDIEAIFGDLPSKYTSNVCLISTAVEFSKILNVPYGAPALGIGFRAGGKMHNRDLLSWGEPLVSMMGPPKGRIVAAERTSVVLNLPQTLEDLGNDWYRTDLMFKVIFPQHLLIHPIK